MKRNGRPEEGAKTLDFMDIPTSVCQAGGIAGIRIVYWGWPTRVAALTNNVGKTRVPTAEYEAFKRDLGVVLGTLKRVDLDKLPKSGCAEMQIRLGGSIDDFFVTKGGNRTNRKMDIDNRIKSAQDVVFKAIGMDDSAVFKVGARKSPHTSLVGKSHETRYTVIEVYFYEEPESFVFTP